MKSLSLLSKLLVVSLLLQGCAGFPALPWSPMRGNATDEGQVAPARSNEKGEPIAASEAEPQRWTPLQLGLWESGQLFRQSSEVHGLRFNLFGARNSHLSGFDFGTFYNRIDGEMVGVQVAGFSNRAEGDSVGFQIAPLGINRVGMIPEEGEATGTFGGIQVGGKNVAVDLDGFQLGLGNNTLRQRGLQLGVISNRSSVITGAQVGLYNNAERGLGIRIGLLATGRSWRGMQLSLWNGSQQVGASATEMTGIQAGLVNVTNDITGMQFGALHNSSSLGTGVQIGLWNVSKILHGLQLGVINSSNQLTGLQVGLWNVNPSGWLPMAPLVNFSVH